jgi:hypothetical protein
VKIGQFFGQVPGRVKNGFDGTAKLTISQLEDSPYSVTISFIMVKVCGAGDFFVF